MARILVINHDDGARELLRIWLQREGHEVIVARAVPEGVNLIQATIINLILIDVRIRGIEALVELHTNSHRTKLIALLPPAVLLEKDDFRSLLQSLGAQRTLSTPFALEEILEAVRAVLASDV
jgi:DNA-binding response OmpR family regulator